MLQRKQRINLLRYNNFSQFLTFIAIEVVNPCKVYQIVCNVTEMLIFITWVSLYTFFSNRNKKKAAVF